MPAGGFIVTSSGWVPRERVSAGPLASPPPHPEVLILSHPEPVNRIPFRERAMSGLSVLSPSHVRDNLEEEKISDSQLPFPPTC